MSELLPPGLVFSDTPSRVWAYALDGFLLGPIYLAIAALFGFDFSNPTLEALPDRNAWVVSALLSVVFNAVYFVWFWSGGRRATPGQRVFAIQVANAFDGQPLTTTQAVKRYLSMGQWVGVLALLPYLAVAVLSFVLTWAWLVVLLLSSIASPTKQGLHDRFADSALVRPAAAGNRWAVGCLWFAILVIALYVLFFAWIMTSVPSSEISNRYMLDYMWQTFRWFWPQ